MPQLLQNVDGLVPLDELDIQYQLRRSESRAILDESGVSVLTLNVGRRRVDLVHGAEAVKAINRHILKNSAPVSNTTVNYEPIVDRLARQSERLELLQSDVRALQRAQQDGSS